MKRILIIWLLCIALLAGCAGAEAVNDHDDEHEHEAFSVPAHIEPVWSGLGLDGKLVIAAFPDAQSIDLFSVDLINGAVTEMFSLEEHAYLLGLDVNPDNGQIVMAFAPPPEEGGIQLGNTDLFIYQPVQEPQPLLTRQGESETFHYPSFISGGAEVIYSHFNVLDSQAQQPFQYTIEKITLDSEVIQGLVEGGYWPAASPDGSLLAFVLYDFEARTYELYLANVDGSDAHLLTEPGHFTEVSAPIFSPNGKWVYFSAPAEETHEEGSWLDELFGVQTAYAHEEGKDWWRVPVSGGEAEQISHVASGNLSGSFSGDGNWLYSASLDGFFVVPAEGGEAVYILPAEHMGGFVDWTP